MDKKHKPRKLDNHNRINAVTSPKHTYLDIIVKLLQVKCKEKILKAASKKKYTTERRTIKICLLKSKKKDLFRPTKTEKAYFQQIHTMRNAKGTFFRQK